MKIIVLTGEAKVGKTHALELLKRVNDGRIDYFQDDIRVSDLLELTSRNETLGVVTTNDWRVKQKIDSENIFTVSQDREQQVRFLVSNKSNSLDWTGAFYWLKELPHSYETIPDIVGDFFNFICK